MVRVADMLDSGRSQSVHTECEDLECPLRWAVIAPLTGEEGVLGALVAYGSRESAVLVRAATEVARWVSVQLELAELDRSRTRLIEAEIRALRAQISPHFIFNSLAAIASFVRTDPERARELLLEFADFTRYSFRRHGDFTNLADELRSIEQYLALAGARFGDRLKVTLQVAPEVLPVTLPFLCLQPLVENAVKHGLEDSRNECRVTIAAQDAGAEAMVTIEDDGVGMDPAVLRGILAGERTGVVGHRPVQCRRTAAPGVRGRSRARHRDGRRRGHEDHDPDPQVPVGRALLGRPPVRGVRFSGPLSRLAPRFVSVGDSHQRGSHPRRGVREMSTLQPPAAANRDDLRSLLGALDPGDRAVVRQLHLLRSTPGEAAAALGIPVAEVHRRATRAVRLLSRGARQFDAA